MLVSNLKTSRCYFMEFALYLKLTNTLIQSDIFTQYKYIMTTLKHIHLKTMANGPSNTINQTFNNDIRNNLNSEYNEYNVLLIPSY